MEIKKRFYPVDSNHDEVFLHASAANSRQHRHVLDILPRVSLWGRIVRNDESIKWLDEVRIEVRRGVNFVKQHTDLKK